MIKKTKLKLLNEIINNKKYFILSLIISIYIFIPELFILRSFKHFIFILANIVILFSISKISKTIFLFLSIITLFINSLILHIILHWGTNGILPRIEIASLSPKSESMEYLMTYLNWIDIFILCYFLVGIYLIYRLFSQLKHSYQVIKILSIVSLFVLLMIFNTLHYTHKIFPYYYMQQYTKVWNKEKIIERKNYLANLKNKTINKNHHLQYDKIIIVMGESVNKSHMSTYDYTIKTTPFLDTLVKNTNGFKYNVISPTNITIYSIPIDLTNAKVDNFNLFFNSKSIITTFKEYGYKTYWLSNQGLVGINDNYITSISNEADFKKTANIDWIDAKDDTILIKYLNGINITNNLKEVYFFHLMGSHFDYKERYPTHSALFKNPKNIIEEYDNTIFHTDNILNQIYNKFSNSKLLFIYLSDHAEVISIKKHGHAFEPAYQDEYDIPLIVYSSEYNSRLTELQHLNNSSFFNMESFNNLVEYIAGIDNNISNISQNLNVFSLKPDNIVNYETLNRFKND